MSNVLRRIDAPTRYGGLTMRAWLAVSAVAVGLVLVMKIARTPILPTAVALSWLLLAPGIVLVMWAHQQGVSVPTLVADFCRYTLRAKRRRVISHRPVSVLRGGIVLSGAPPKSADEAPRWEPAKAVDS